MVFNERTKLGQLFEDEECALDCIYYVTRKLDMTDEQESECLDYTIYDIAEMEGTSAEKLAKKIQKYYKKNSDDFVDKIEFVSILDRDDEEDEDEGQDAPISNKTSAEVRSNSKSEKNAESDDIVLQIVEEQDKEQDNAILPKEEQVSENVEQKKPAADISAAPQSAPKQAPVHAPAQGTEKLTPDEVLRRVKDALEAAGYDPYKQLAQYFVTKDATYITSKGNARNLIRSADTHSLIEALIKNYFK